MTVISNLQVLRAVAAAMVVVHHLRSGLAEAYPSVSQIVVGAAGVDIFFVLSGVVITLAEHRRHGTPHGFMMRRILRVVPMYWLALAVVACMLLAGLSPLGVQQADVTLGNMLRSMFFVPFERAHGAVMPLLGVGWTLNYEMFFYAVFAAMMLVPGAIRPFAIVTVMVGLVCVGMVLGPIGTLPAFYTNPILLEFAGGVVLARLWLARPDARRHDRALGTLLLGTGVILLAWHARIEGFAQLMPARVIVFGLPALLCVWGAMLLERGGIAIRHPFAMLLGAASYVLYLFHALVLQGLEVAIRAMGGAGEGALAVLLVAGVGFVLSHLVAILLHLQVEKPLTALLRRPKTAVRIA